MKLLDLIDQKLTEKLDATHHKADILEEGTAIYKHREWRGLKDTAYDFSQWARLWGILLKWDLRKEHGELLLLVLQRKKYDHDRCCVQEIL